MPGPCGESPMPSNPPSSGRYEIWVFTSLPLLYAGFWVLFTSLLGVRHGGQPYNADLLHPYLLAQDLLRDPAALFDWYHSPALYVFPDWIAAMVLVWLPISDAAMPLHYGAALLTAYCVFAAALLAHDGRIGRLAAVGCTAGAIVINALLAFYVVPASISSSFFVTLSSSYVHTGALATTLLGFAVVLAQLRTGPTRRGLWALGVVTFVGTFSDFIFVPWFVVPACAVALAWMRLRDRAVGWRCLRLVAATAVVAIVLEKAIRWGGGFKGRPANPFDSAAALGQEFMRLVQSTDWLIVALIMVFSALVARTALLAHRVWRGRPLAECGWLELLLGLSCVLTVVAPVATAAFEDQGSLRYLISIFVLCPTWVLYWLLRGALRVWRHADRALALAGALALGGAGISQAGAALAAQARIGQPSALARCLIAEGRSAGFGEYWSAKNLMFETGRAIHVIQLARNGRLQRWNYNRRWFLERADDGGPLAPDFVILDNLDREAMRARFGDPAREVRCGRSEVWLYDHVLPHNEAPTVELPASALRGALGRVEGDARVASAPADAKGVLTYGPYIDLPMGRYLATLHYSASGDGHRWDVVHSGGKRSLGKGPLASTGGATSRLEIAFEARDPLRRVEVRTHFSGRGELHVERLVIRPAS